MITDIFLTRENEWNEFSRPRIVIEVNCTNCNYVDRETEVDFDHEIAAES